MQEIIHSNIAKKIKHFFSEASWEHKYAFTYLPWVYFYWWCTKKRNFNTPSAEFFTAFLKWRTQKMKFEGLVMGYDVELTGNEVWSAKKLYLFL